MLTSVIQLLLLFFIPLACIYVSKIGKIGSLLSPIVICYIVGMILGNVFPELNSNISKQVSEICLVLAIPMLLFSANLLAWLKNGKKFALSFLFSIIAIVISAGVFGFLFQNQFTEVHKMSGMLVGVYTGGTPNLASIGYALNIDQNTFVALHASDTLVCGIYLIFLTSIAQKVLNVFFPKSVKQQMLNAQASPKLNTPTQNTYSLKEGGLAFLIAAVVAGLSLGLTFLVYGNVSDDSIALLMLFLTSLALLCSFSPKIQSLKASYPLGQYLLLVFSYALGLMVNFQQLISGSSSIFLFTLLVVIGALLLHYLLCFIGRIDTDTLIISSTASIFGPVFIGQVAGALNNEEMVFPGMAAGLFGYAIGNYVGLGLAFGLERLLS